MTEDKRHMSVILVKSERKAISKSGLSQGLQVAAYMFKKISLVVAMKGQFSSDIKELLTFA